MTTDCLHYVFTTSTVPATGPRGARATSVLPAQRSSASVIEAYRRGAWRRTLAQRLDSARRSDPRNEKPPDASAPEGTWQLCCGTGRIVLLAARSGEQPPD